MFQVGEQHVTKAKWQEGLRLVGGTESRPVVHRGEGGEGLTLKAGQAKLAKKILFLF